MAKKKICFYSVLCTGHLNVCSSISSVLLDKYSDKIEIYFIADKVWSEKLLKIDNRFKILNIDYENKEQNDRFDDFVNNLEPFLKSSFVDRIINSWANFLDWNVLKEIDEKSEARIKEINPDLLLCDQVCHLPAMSSASKYAFITSCNPVLHNFEQFPKTGSDARSDDRQAIRKYDEEFSNYRNQMNKELLDFFEKRGSKFRYDGKFRVDQPLTDLFTIYCFPKEIDYYDDSIRQKYNLYQIDSALYPKKIPAPFKLPKDFDELPGKIVYVSLGSLFSAYVEKLQRLVDILDRIPNAKFIVSKGANGNKLRFPSKKFYGENYIDQLGVLQIVDVAITHGGNNTNCECFYFGVPQIIMPAVVDQINNSSRIEECGFGIKLDLLNYTEEELKNSLFKLFNDNDLKTRLKNVSERIRRENKIESAATRIIEFLEINHH